MSVIEKSTLPNLIYRGKIRDTHDVGNDVLLMILTNQIESLRSTKNAVKSIKDNIIEERTITQSQIETIRDFVADLAERLIVLEKKL